ncbi:hypothetical protein ABZP36_009964 [Zizania latifolia]
MYASMAINVTHIQLVGMLWFFLYSPNAAATLASLPVLVESMQRQGCPSKCGEVEIPYPFGIGDNCAWPGFTVSCNDSFNPPRPYYSNIEIKDISLEKGEMRIYTPVTYNCYNSSRTTEPNGTLSLQLDVTDTPFLVAQKSNEFTGIGCDNLAMLQGKNDWSFFTGCITTCVSLDEAAEDGETCTGLGCCQVTSIPANLSTIFMPWANNVSENNAWSYSPCNYAFVAQKGWYNFSRQDLSRSGSKSFVYSDGDRSVPTVLDWAIRRNGSCSSETQLAPACVSNHSYCFNATNGEGYLCNCTTGYAGNPYVTGDGECTNINECEQSPCSGGGTCHDLQGSYVCKCKFPKRKEMSKNGQTVCEPVLNKQVIVVIATIGGIAIFSILLILLLMVYEKKRLRDIFNKNGGQLLKNKGIKLFTKQQISKITHNYGTIIGNGGFGVVYEGNIDKKQKVAVKRSKKISNNRLAAVVKRIFQRSTTDDEDSRKNMADEIIIQSQISHKNVVGLVGCCLETDIPMLVFEYIPEGSLHDVLHVKKRNLTLDQRLAIAIGSAEALDFMHSSASQKILHGDVKPENILLDHCFVPKVSDFGISKFMTIEKDHTNKVIGSIIYMDPMYYTMGILTEKSDVYSFGVVLLELITRKKAIYDGNNSLKINFVKSYMSDSRAREMFDEELASSPQAIDCLDMIGRIAVQSLKEDVDERPTMKQVLEQLHLVRNKWMQTQN